MRRENLPDGIRITDDRGILTLRRPAPHVELIRCDGFARWEHIDMVLASREQIIRECGKIALFDDLEDLRGYDSDVRSKLTDWSSKNRDKIVAFHILVRSKIVAMGVSLANLAIGGKIAAHTRRAEFETVLAREVSQR